MVTLRFLFLKELYCVFLYVGYLVQEVSDKWKNIFWIYFLKEDTELLDEVVIVGMGPKRKLHYPAL